MRTQKAYIKYNTDDDKWVYLLDPKAPVATIMSFDSVDKAEDYLYLNHKEDRYDYMIVTND